jgi:arsenate reductase (thioredoxin)
VFSSNLYQILTIMVYTSLLKNRMEVETMKKIHVLFVCVHNSARSQMAEAFLNHLAADRFEAESSGLTPGQINPVVVAVMQELGFDISNNATNSVFEFLKQGRKYDFVITVCDQSASERCPMFPGRAERLHWSFDDPSAFTGTEKEIKNKTRKVRDQIKTAIEEFIASCKDFRLRMSADQA